MKNAIAIVAGLLALVAIIPYLIDIVRGKTRPNIVTWFTWTLLLIIGTAGAFVAHQNRSAFLTLGDTIGTGLTLILGLKYGIAKFTRLDIFCQIGAVIGLLLWWYFDSPAVGIVAVVIIDFIAAVPTLYHSWHKPQEETWQTFLVLVVASTLTITVLSNYTVASLAYPVYLLFIDFAVAAVVVFRRLSQGIKLSRHSIHETLHE
jgi:hypothetical protein